MCLFHLTWCYARLLIRQEQKRDAQSSNHIILLSNDCLTNHISSITQKCKLQYLGGENEISTWDRFGY